MRDMLLGLSPPTTTSPPTRRRTEVMRIFPETYAVGAQFGVVLVPAAGRHADTRTNARRSIPH